MAECDTNNEIIKFFTPPFLRLNETYLIRSKSMSAGCFGEVRVGKISLSERECSQMTSEIRGSGQLKKCRRHLGLS